MSDFSSASSVFLNIEKPSLNEEQLGIYYRKVHVSFQWSFRSLPQVTRLTVVAAVIVIVVVDSVVNHCRLLRNHLMVLFSINPVITESV